MAAYRPAHILMIQLTRLNNQALMVNSDLIKFVEQSPDTVISLTTGEKLIVRESAEQILEKIVRFRLSIGCLPSHLKLREPDPDDNAGPSKG
jgi:flagellar protein FlbD